MRCLIEDLREATGRTQTRGPGTDLDDEIAAGLNNLMVAATEERCLNLPLREKGHALEASFSGRIKALVLGEAKHQIVKALTGDLLERIWELLELASQASPQGLTITYDAFRKVQQQLELEFGPFSHLLLSGSRFLKFHKDQNVAISTRLYFKYVSEMCSCIQMWLRISYGTGEFSETMREDQVPQLLLDLMPQIPCIRDIQGSPFLATYLAVAGRKFAFFHGAGGPHPTALRCADVVGGPIMAELLELRHAPPHDPDLTSNWFSRQCVERLHKTFVSWDRDGSDTLSQEEFGNISQGTMTPFFISRVFQEHVGTHRDVRLGATCRTQQYRNKDEMGMMDFVDFILAWDHRRSAASLRYFFTVFDINKQGFLTPTELYIFFKEVHAKWTEMGEAPTLSIQDVVDEILDMIKPVNIWHITMQDLIKSKMADTVFGMLANVTQFYEYNFRENFLQQEFGTEKWNSTNY